MAEPIEDDDQYAHDPGRWGASLKHAKELLFPVLDAAEPKSILEIGAYAGDLTRVLLEWADPHGAEVVAVDPTPPEELQELVSERPDLEVIGKTSHEALSGLTEVPDAVLIDGDHNYFTVKGEVDLVAEKAEGGDLPLLLFHDVIWPHGRRDTYYAPERLPEEGRQPMTAGGLVFPGNEGLADDGLPYPWAADREGGPRNGVLTAVEDFVAEHEGLQLAVVPVFFGFGVVYHRDASYADELARLLEPWDRNPVLARLEANRVYHLTVEHNLAREAIGLREKVAKQEHLLRSMLASSALPIGEAFSRLRRRGGDPAFSRGKIREALGEDAD